MELLMKQASFLDTVRTVLWAAKVVLYVGLFAGIGFQAARLMKKLGLVKAAHEQANIRPAHVIIMAVIFVVVFILTLRFIVSLVLS